MAQFRRKGPACYAATTAHGRARLVDHGEVVEADFATGWADDPGWELVTAVTTSTGVDLPDEEQHGNP